MILTRIYLKRRKKDTQRREVGDEKEEKIE